MNLFKNCLQFGDEVVVGVRAYIDIDIDVDIDGVMPYMAISLSLYLSISLSLYAYVSVCLSVCHDYHIQYSYLLISPLHNMIY